MTLKSTIQPGVLTILFICSSFLLQAQQTAVLEWASRIGGTGTDRARDLVLDASGNVYVSGFFTGTVDFDPGTATFNLTSTLTGTAFAAKYDPNGNLIWAKSYGGNSAVGQSITVDVAGNVYLTGGFEGTGDFDPGAGVFNMTARTTTEADIYILKLDVNGNFVWAKEIDGGTWFDNGYEIKLDAAGNVFVIGRFYYQGGPSFDFDPGPGVFLLTATHEDIFILKLDNDGNFAWARDIGAPTGADEHRGYSLAIDGSGNLYMTGYFEGTVDFDPGAGTTNLTASGDWDIFFTKFDNNGNFVWAKQMLNSAPTYYTDGQYGSKIEVDASGNVYTTGRYNGTVDFDFGTGTYNLTSNGGFDIYLLKMTTNGDFVWAKSMGGTGYDEGFSLSTTATGNSYVAGFFSNTVDFDPGAGTLNLTSAGGSDAFVSRFDTNGNLVWARSLGGASSDLGYGVATNSTGDIFLTGSFNGTADFDPSPGSCTNNMTSAGGEDIFIVKLNQIAALSITSTSAASGAVGSTIIITGTGFSAIPGNNVVEFNNIVATVTASTTTSITTTVPAGATTGPIEVTVQCATVASPYFCVTGTPPSTIGLVADYPFAGNANDASGNNNNGTVNGATLTTDRFGNANSAYLFNGTSSDISVATSASLQSPTTQLTLSAWVNLAGYSLVGDPFAPIFTKSTGTGSNFMYGFAIGASGQLEVLINNYSNYAQVPMSLNLNQWYMLTAVMDNTVANFYVNGILIGTQTFTTNIVSDALGLQIGRDSPGLTEIFNGKLDDIKIYNRALSACEVAALFVSPVAPPPTITGVSPTSGPVGTSVTISGTNFSATISENIVFFGGVQATVTAATSTQITATVPAGATFKSLTVSVNGLTAHAPKPFVVTFAGGGIIDNCSFEPAVTIGTTALSNVTTLADIDGDGQLDLVTPERTSNQASIFRNTSTAGNISFAPKIILSGLPAAIATAVGDVDSDGKPDVVVVNYTNGELSVYKNQSTPGTISLAARVVFSVPGFTHDVSIADIDGDGKQDLIITASIQGLIVYRNTGTPGVINATTFAAGLTFATGANAYPFTLGDIDGDGKLDAVVPNADTYSFSVLRNTSTPGTVSFASPVTLTTNTGTPTPGYGAGYAALGDFDDDSKLDLVTVSNTITKVSFFRNISTPGNLTFDTRFDIATTGIMSVPAVSDLNGDGKIDFIVDQGPTESLVFQNTASSGSINAASFNAPIVVSRLSAYLNRIGDLDNDGRNDFISTSTNVQVFRNLNGTIPAPTMTSFSPTLALVGSTVTINGTNFSTPFGISVEFNGTIAPIIDSTPGSITVSVPAGATTGPLSVTIGCNTIISGTNFTVAIPANITITTQPTDITVCPGDIATFTTAATGTTNIIYQWQYSLDGVVPFTDIANSGGYSNVTTNTLSINTTGNFGAGRYRCRINGDFAAEVFSNDEGLFISATPSPPITTGNSVCNSGSLMLTAAGGANGQYRWYTAPTGGSAITGEVNSTYITPVLVSTTTYYVSLFNGSCESTRTPVIATITIPPVKPVIASSIAPVGNALTICSTTTLTLSAPNGFALYNWSTGATTSQINVSTTGTYSVTVTDGAGCTSPTSDVITVTVVPAPCNNSAPVINITTSSTTIGGQATINLLDLISDADNNLVLSSLTIAQQPTSGATAVITNGILEIDYKGVSFSGRDQITIEVCDVFGECTQQVLEIDVIGDIEIYNGISPNNDDQNEIFLIRYIDLLPDTQNNKVTIYNRWGSKVFEVSNYNNTTNVFRGLNDSGNELPSGTYFYKISYESNRKAQTGYLSLKR